MSGSSQGEPLVFDSALSKSGLLHAAAVPSPSYLPCDSDTHAWEETQKPQRYLTFHMPRSTSDKKKKKNKKRGKDSTHQANDDIVADSSEGVLSDGVSSESSLDVPSKSSPGRPKKEPQLFPSAAQRQIMPLLIEIQKKDGLLYNALLCSDLIIGMPPVSMSCGRKRTRWRLEQQKLFARVVDDAAAEATHEHARDDAVKFVDGALRTKSTQGVLISSLLVLAADDKCANDTPFRVEQESLVQSHRRC